MKLSPLEKVTQLLERWNAEELKQLQSWLSVRIEQLESLAQEIELPPVKSGRVALSVHRFNSIVYRLEKVRCGKENCHRCPHGPYWYGYQRSNGKVVSFYVGKKLPENLM
ncbi:MAG: hypothetical protein F6K32_09585 [Desertifilum sp. SIO1I2]|nr:hypothetical protein [Desertifilum sp. SIO1I2]